MTGLWADVGVISLQAIRRGADGDENSAGSILLHDENLQERRAGSGLWQMLLVGGSR